MNKIFAFFLFLIGIGLVLTAARANPVIGYITPGAPLLDTWASSGALVWG